MANSSDADTITDMQGGNKAAWKYSAGLMYEYGIASLVLCENN